MPRKKRAASCLRKPTLPSSFTPSPQQLSNLAIKRGRRKLTNSPRAQNRYEESDLEAGAAGNDNEEENEEDESEEEEEEEEEVAEGGDQEVQESEFSFFFFLFFFFRIDVSFAKRDHVFANASRT